MKTDTLFYELFRAFNSLLFELIEQPPSNAEGYEFLSVEVKEKAFRFDGVFVPDVTDKSIIFTEVQVRFVCPKGGKPLRMGSMGGY
jgi:predicted transposase YdaD